MPTHVVVFVPLCNKIRYKPRQFSMHVSIAQHPWHCIPAAVAGIAVLVSGHNGHIPGTADALDGARTNWKGHTSITTEKHLNTNYALCCTINMITSPNKQMPNSINLVCYLIILYIRLSLSEAPVYWSLDVNKNHTRVIHKFLQISSIHIQYLTYHCTYQPIAHSSPMRDRLSIFGSKLSCFLFLFSCVCRDYKRNDL